MRRRLLQAQCWLPMAVTQCFSGLAGLFFLVSDRIAKWLLANEDGHCGEPRQGGVARDFDDHLDRPDHVTLFCLPQPMIAKETHHV